MRITAITFLSVYILALLAPVATVVNFAINQEEIAEKFCENKDLPELKCEGKCHLAKVLAKQTNEHTEKSSSVNQFIYLIGKIEPLYIKSTIGQENKLFYGFLNKAFNTNVIFSIDHPPQV